MATKQDIKDFFALTGNNPPVTNAQLLSIEDFLSDRLTVPTMVTEDTLIDYIYQILREQVISHKRTKAPIAF